MKKRLLLYICFLFVLNKGFGQAAIYHPFHDTNAVWRVDDKSGANCGGGLYKSYQYTMGGDCIKNYFTII